MGLAGGRGVDVGDQRVPPQGQISRQGEGGPARQDSVDVVRERPVVRLGQLAPAAVLQVDMHTHTCTVGHVDGHADLFPGAGDDGRRQGAPPGSDFDLRQRGLDFLVRASLDTEGRLNSDERGSGRGGEITALD